MMGMYCYKFRFPRDLKRKVYSGMVKVWNKRGKPVETWHVRAFCYGLMGLGFNGKQRLIVPESYQWPEPPKGWFRDFIVYPDGYVRMDFFHPVSRHVWGDENEVPQLPYFEDGSPCLSCYMLDFLHIPYMTPFYVAEVSDEKPAPHLKLING